MRTKDLIQPFFILIISFSCLFLNAQVKVESTGRVQVGTVPPGPNDAGNVASMQVFGKINDGYASGSMITLGDFGIQSLQGWNVFIGEYGTTDTDKLWLHGKNGVYLTYSNGTVLGYYDVTSGNAFRFNCDVYSSGIKLTSDERLKENVQPLRGSLTSLQQLGGVSYYLKIRLLNRQGK